jgi:Flp pilus assembly protein TadG
MVPLRRLDGDRGAITLEAVLILPVVLALIMAVINVAIWLYARDIALNAARQGLATARDDGSSPGAGGPAAVAFAARTGGGYLTGVHASVSLSGGVQNRTVSVTVTGQALSVLPFWHQGVAQTAQAPLEEFTTP